MKVLKLTLVILGALVVLIAATMSRTSVQPKPVAAPALVGSGWLNLGSETPASKGFEGKVTVLHFWAFECINCRHNLPYYAKWAANYKPSDVQVIGVHTPELPAERDPGNVRQAARRLGVTYPVLLDEKGKNWDRYHIEAWPTIVLIDRRGRERYRWTGELNYGNTDGFAEVTRQIEMLRREG